MEVPSPLFSVFPLQFINLKSADANNRTHHSSADLTITVAARGSVLCPNVTNVSCYSSSELQKSSPCHCSPTVSRSGAVQLQARKERIVQDIGVHIRSTWAWTTRVFIMPKYLPCSYCRSYDEYTFLLFAVSTTNPLHIKEICKLAARDKKACPPRSCTVRLAITKDPWQIILF